jgi:hypothetical protein
VRAQSLNLELLQETLGEARAGRIAVWETLSVPALNNHGSSSAEIIKLFESQTEQAQNFAYGLAEKMRDNLLGTETTGNVLTVADDDRQGTLNYEDSRALPDHDE